MTKVESSFLGIFWVFLLTTQACAFPEGYQAVQSIAALQSLGSASPVILNASVSAYYSGGGVGGGQFAWDPASTAAADGCVTFAATGVTIGRWIRKLSQPHQIDVTDCGAQPSVTSAANDAAIEAAFSYSYSRSSRASGLVAPASAYEQPAITWAPGHYFYGGAGIVVAGHNVVTTAIPRTVSITIIRPVYFLTSTGFTTNSYVYGLHFIGGLGAFHYTYKPAMVGGFHVFCNNIFSDYTEAAIANESSDSPYLKACDSQFYGTATSIGIAWGGFGDTTEIVHNSFVKNKFHIKIGARLGGSIFIADNDFHNSSPATVAYDLWIVPNTTDASGVSSGAGFFIQRNRWGNENLVSSQSRILAALEDTRSGTDRANFQPLLVWQAKGAYITGPVFEGNRVVGAGNLAAPFMVSYINEIRNLQWTADNTLEGSRYTYLCQFVGGTWTGSYSNSNWSVSFGAASNTPGNTAFSVGITNASNGVYVDKSGLTSWTPGVELARSSIGDDTGYVGLAGAAGYGDLRLVNATAVATAGGLKIGTTASEVTLTAANGFVSKRLLSVTPGALSELDLDLAQGGSNSLSSVKVELVNYTDKRVIVLDRTVPLPANWKTGRIPFVMPLDTNPATWEVRVIGNDYSAGSATNFRVGNVNVYHAGQAMNSGNLRVVGANAGKWNGGHIIMGGGTAWVQIWHDFTVNVSRWKFGSSEAASRPTAENDGNLLGMLAGVQNGTGDTHTVAVGATTTVFANTTFDGSVGSAAYTVGDIVKALKNLGLLAR